MAGVLVDLAIAGIAVIVWANTSTGTVHAIAYNAVFVASISTILFNGNFLLRFDGYYVLADILEMPNLSQRSRDYLYYLVRRYVFGVKRAWSPAHTPGERYWFVFYGVSAATFRIFVSVRIILFLNDTLPEEFSIVVPVLIFSVLVGWVAIPLGKFLRYLATGPELARNRSRALASTAGFAFALVMGLGVLKAPHYSRVEGIVEPVRLAIIYAETDGFVSEVLPSGVEVLSDGVALVQSYDARLYTQHEALTAERRALSIRHAVALGTEVVAAQILAEERAVLDDKIVRLNERIDGLQLRAPIAGTWISADAENLKGRYIHHGEAVGVISDLSGMMIRATAGQNLAAILIEQARPEVEIRGYGLPDVTLAGTMQRIFPAGQQVLPSEALGYSAGGSVPTDMRDPSGTRSVEKFFEIRVQLHSDASHQWRTGQRVVVRFRLRDKPFAVQFWQYARQILQRRFRI